MGDQDTPLTPGLERFREYLLILARSQWGGGAGDGKLEPSDLVQETLLEAHRKLTQFRGRTDAEVAAWLRAMLAFALKDARRAWGRDRRDTARERSLDDALDRSSVRLGGCLAADQTSPSQGAERHERAVRLADALSRLPEAQRQAVVLRHFEGCSLDEISRRLGRTPAAVAGLLKRGARQLREMLEEQGIDHE